MVVWRLYKKENPITLNSYEIEAIDRTASLIANSSYRGGENDGNPFDVSDWIDKVNTGIHELLGPDGRIKIYTKEDRKTVIHSCLVILASKSIGLQRIRLYVYLKRKGKFVCISSLSTSNATLEGQTEQDFYGSYTDNNLKIGRRQINADENNEYCQFTINRFLENPYAMHQHKDMFKEEDINTGPLDKDEHGRWIVCPIAKRRDNNGKKTGNLAGFISADNHAKVVGSNDNKLTEMKSNELTDYFQRYALDVISNLLYPAVFLITRYDSSDLSKKVKKAEAARRSKRRGKGATG